MWPCGHVAMLNGYHWPCGYFTMKRSVIPITGKMSSRSVAAFDGHMGTWTHEHMVFGHMDTRTHDDLLCGSHQPRESMKVSLVAASKSFGRETVFRDLSHVFESGSRTAILGPNGSGKSTLLQCVAGALTLTKGSIAHEVDGNMLEQEQVYRHVSIAAPYLNLYEELSLAETIGFHARFKPLRAGIDVQTLARTAMLEQHMHKPVRNFSSGMKQRLKLALAILSDTPLLLLDEPASNLDATGAEWFKELLAAHVDGRTLVVASNRQEAETLLCVQRIDLASTT